MTNVEGRPSLRDEQIQRTKDRILEAAAEIITEDLAALSVQAVARRSGVSRPTVYRYFKNKREILDGLGAKYRQTIGVDRPYSSFDEAIEDIPARFERHTRVPATLQAAAWIVREQSNASPARVERIRRQVDELEGLSDEDSERLALVCAVFASGSTRLAFERLTGVEARQAGELVAWAIRHIVAGARGEADA